VGIGAGEALSIFDALEGFDWILATTTPTTSRS